MNNLTMGLGSYGGHRSRLFFTSSQWQELEHQALIFKYMTAGIPVPPDLLMPLRKSLTQFTGLSALSAPRYSTLGWRSSNLRFANSTDPEPGRCRRTDGKKWRCSREVAPDQKYCERHMNRGRPRSRKLVEGQIGTSNSSSNSKTTSNYTDTLGGHKFSSSLGSSISLAAGRKNPGSTNFTSLSPSFCINSHTAKSTMGIKGFSASGRDVPIPGGVSSCRLNKPPFHMISVGGSGGAASAVSNKDHRYMNWMRDVDEQLHFSEGKGLGYDSHQTMTSLAMLSSVNTETKHNNSLLQYSCPQLRTILGQDFSLMPDTNQMNLQLQEQQEHQHQHQHQQHQHSFLSTGLGNDQSSEGQHLRHFFDDWPRTTRDPTTISWPDMEERSSNSTITQLSMSLPMTISDFPPSPRGKMTPSSLKLSMSAARSPTEENPLDPTQMVLGVGMGLGLLNEDRHRQTNNWIPVTWHSQVGGPLAEVLQSSTTNAGGTPGDGSKSSGHNLMDDKWELRPRGGPRIASPTGVLQKTLASLSDSSSGSSSQAVAAAAAAKHEMSLQQNVVGGM